MLWKTGGGIGFGSSCCCNTANCTCGGASPACTLCTLGDSILKYHVTFSGITLCPGCVSCPATGLSMNITAGSTINGTYLLTQNGACAWTCFSNLVPTTGKEWASTNCTGANQGLGWAIQLVRISTTQFRLQITDASNTILLFDAFYTSTPCCVNFTVSNALTTCACSGTGPTIYALGTGGTGSVSAC
jgi:hypothetical protein